MNEPKHIELITPREKARELKVSVQTLARWRREDNTGPIYYKLGNKRNSRVRYLKGVG